MQRLIVAVLCVGFAVACHSGPQVRPGPPLTPMFAPPPGMMQLARSQQERTSSLRFSDKTGEGTSIRQVEEARETYVPLPDGGFRVTSTLLSQSLSRDGQEVTPPLSTAGISLVFRINKQGEFVVLENGEDVLRALRDRAADEQQRKVISQTFTTELIEAVPRESWRERHDRFCGRTFNPGDVYYSVASFELPLPARAPVRALVKNQVLGKATFGMTEVMEIHRSYFGAEDKRTKDEGAQQYIATLPPGERAITAKLSGEGRRVVSLSTCETLEETLNFEGTIPLNLKDPNVPKAVLPDSVQFSIRQQVVRSSPSEAPVSR